MNKKNLDLIFEQYIDRFYELNDPDGNNEGYKWTAETCFTEHWDIDAEDFPTMFKAAMKEMSNLIDNSTVQPIGGLLLLLKQPDEVEFVRECFRDLYADDGGDIDARQDRIYTFMEKINARIDLYAKGSWKYPQSMNNVIYYLSLRYPDENYIFKSTEATDWANCIEYGDDFGSGQTFSLRKYYKMCDELLEEVSHNEEIRSLHQCRFDKTARGFDDKLHILVYDIIYCAHNYHFYTDGMVNTTSAKERIKRAKLREEMEEVSRQIADVESRIAECARSSAAQIDMLGMEVSHKAFGKGRVIAQASGIQTVTFSNGDKRFQFPSAYVSGFLEADGEVVKMIRDAAQKEKDLSVLEKELQTLKDRHSILSRSL